MEPKLTELIEALPIEVQEPPSATANDLLRMARELSQRPVPVGSLTRLWSLGTLQAKIAAAYLAYWIRSRYASDDEKERALNEAHLRSALRTLGTMGYLRGAVMKMGQLLASWPDVVPAEFADILSRLHFEAPPMHFSLLREQVRNELGRDPEDVFDDFEPEAFAAASLGQVHRARLKGTGQRVAVKVQYPNIARTIRDDFRALQALMVPMRIKGDWDSLKRQFEDLRGGLEQETDYEIEAEHLRYARTLFREDEGIVIPKVYPEWSGRRVLTMEYLEGVHLERFLAAQPTQEVRDQYGRKIAVTTFRLWYTGRLLYADPHPGNYLFMPEGRLGFIDFGCCRPFSDDDWDYLLEMERAVFTSNDAVRTALRRASALSPSQPAHEGMLKLWSESSEWIWRPTFQAGAFDFSDPEYFRQGVVIMGEAIRQGYFRNLPVNNWLMRMFYGLKAMLFHLKARLDYGEIYRTESTVYAGMKQTSPDAPFFGLDRA